MNDLRRFFYEKTSGHGIWKWDHYFEIYERHFSKFRGKDVRILEIGIYSGGSLEMWREYFGPQAMIYGIDIQPECKVYENDRTRIFIGNEADQGLWDEFKSEVRGLDIVVDDGSHKSRHQSKAMGELFPLLSAGGVYLCEDIHGYPENNFATEIYDLSAKMNDHGGFRKEPENPDRRLSKPTTEIQASIEGIYLYPYVVVIEKRDERIDEFVAPKRGTQWQPFKK